MTDEACPSELALDLAISVGPTPELLAHLEACEACRALWEDTQSAVELARDLPFAVPDAHHLEERRTAMLAAWQPEAARLAAPEGHLRAPEPAVIAETAPPPPARRGRWAPVGLIAAAAALSVIVLVVSTRSSSQLDVVHPHRGVVHAHEGTRFTLAAHPPDEIVRLRTGVIDVDVDPLAVGERFRVVVGTDEVEVRGTSFEVIAAADRLVSVHVVHGRVEVKRVGNPVVVLAAGESWHVTAPTAPALPTPAPVLDVVAPSPPSIPHPPGLVVKRSAPREETATAPPKVARTVDPQELAFVQGWEAMRQGEYGPAAAAFNRAIALSPDGDLTEDSMFWRAVAIARLHRTTEAIGAFRAFLDAFPTSTRAGEAAAMLGWLLVETHELDEAKRRFHSAENDPHAGARASALQGLERLGDKAN